MARACRLADLARPALQMLPGARTRPGAARPEGLAPEHPGSALLGAAASVYSMNFLIPVIVLVGAIGYWASRRSTSRYIGDPGVEANARLTGFAAMVLLLPLAAEVVTGARPGLLAHALLGFFLVPPVLLKLGSVGYRLPATTCATRATAPVGRPVR